MKGHYGFKWLIMSIIHVQSMSHFILNYIYDLSSTIFSVNFVLENDDECWLITKCPQVVQHHKCLKMGHLLKGTYKHGWWTSHC